MVHDQRFLRAYEGREGDAENGARMTVYEAEGGEKEIRIAGSPAWRNNNPGNLRPSKYNKRQIGSAWGFAVFGSREDGLAAMKDLLRRPVYARLSLERAMYRYAPPADNNPTHAYLDYVSRRSGVGFDVRLGSLDAYRLDEVVTAMMAFEGQKVGRVRREV
ncbi:MAG: hypothetical protein EON60_01475 [Alphaproteobacteria bacterium]|nr:MAG: hypothetical protein EON60_01475 [Alphaproteobacteria bacterium]